MNKFGFLVVISIVMLLMTSPVFAYSFLMGGNSALDLSDTVDALTLQYSLVSNLAGRAFDLDEGECADFWFAKIYSDESAINKDDLAASTVTAYVDFVSPEIMASIGGTSVGFKGGFLNNHQGWQLVWDGPQTVDFGNGGQFEVSLENAYYDSHLWRGPDGSDCIKAKVCLNSDVNPVPEPMTMLLFGPALLGLVGLKKRKA